MRTINLGKGHPSSRLLPPDLLEQGLRLLGAANSRAALQYGGASGAAAFAEAMAGFLSERYGHKLRGEELLPTAGNSMTLNMICQLFTQPGDAVVCSDPTYFHAMSIFQTAGLQLRTVQVDHNGMCTDELEQLLAAGLRPRLLYCIPAFHNPCGVNLSPARAQRLVELAEEYDFLVVADEPYHLLHFGPEAPASMMHYDGNRGRVVALGSFSKLLAPGLRCGWLHAAPPLLARFAEHGAMRSGGHLNPWLAALITQLVTAAKLGPHIDELRRVYRTRMDRLCNALAKLSDPVDFVVPAGGYFVWLPLAPARFAAAEVTVIAGSRCSPNNRFASHSRLSISACEADAIAEAIGRLRNR